MSWDASLISNKTGEVLAEWNYTHNTNMMANLVLYPDFDTAVGTFDALFSDQYQVWWKLLDGKGGRDGAEFLGRILAGLHADPARFQKLNPNNGWGSYASFVAVLEHMRGSVPTEATRWYVTG